MSSDEILYQIIKDTVDTSKSVVSNTKIISDTSKEIMRVLQDIVPRLEVTEVNVEDLKEDVRDSTREVSDSFKQFSNKVESLDKSFTSLAIAVSKVDLRCPADIIKKGHEKWLRFIVIALIVENFALLGKLLDIDLLGKIIDKIPGLG